MDPKHLQSFLAVADSGGFTAAGRAIGLPQPAVSQHVLALELALGTKLFERGRRGARLTDGGDRLLPHARLILENLQRAREEVSGLDDRPAGRVSIGLPQSVSIAIAARLATEVRRRYPAIRLRLVEALSGHLQEWVETGRLDFAVLFAGDGLPPAAGQEIMVESLSLVGAPAQMDGFGRRVTARRAARLPLIVPGPPHGLRLLLDHAFRALGVSADPVFEIDSAEAIRSLVGAGQGYTIFPATAVAAEVAAGRLATCEIANPRLTRKLVLARSPSRIMNAAALAVAALVRECLGRR